MKTDITNPMVAEAAFKIIKQNNLDLSKHKEIIYTAIKVANVELLSFFAHKLGSVYPLEHPRFMIQLCEFDCCSNKIEITPEAIKNLCSTFLLLNTHTQITFDLFEMNPYTELIPAQVISTLLRRCKIFLPASIKDNILILLPSAKHGAKAAYDFKTILFEYLAYDHHLSEKTLTSSSCEYFRYMAWTHAQEFQGDEYAQEADTAYPSITNMYSQMDTAITHHNEFKNAVYKSPPLYEYAREKLSLMHPRQIPYNMVAKLWPQFRHSLYGILRQPGLSNENKSLIVCTSCIILQIVRDKHAGIISNQEFNNTVPHNLIFAENTDTPLQQAESKFTAQTNRYRLFFKPETSTIDICTEDISGLLVDNFWKSAESSNEYEEQMQILACVRKPCTA